MHKSRIMVWIYVRILSLMPSFRNFFCCHLPFHMLTLVPLRPFFSFSWENISCFSSPRGQTHGLSENFILGTTLVGLWFGMFSFYFEAPEGSILFPPTPKSGTKIILCLEQKRCFGQGQNHTHNLSTILLLKRVWF